MLLVFQTGRKWPVLLVLFFFMVIRLTAAGYHIRGNLSNCTAKAAYLTLIYADNQYIVDSAKITDGQFEFDGNLKLKSGVYLIVFPSVTSFFILIDENQPPEFSFKGDFNNIHATVRFEGSLDNQLYYEYLRFFEETKLKLESIKSNYDKQKEEKDRIKLLADMQAVKQYLTDYQKKLVGSAAGSLTAAIINCELAPEVPEFEGSQEEVQLKKYNFYRSHYFDNINLKDERLIRAPRQVLVDKVDLYVDKMTIQHPDSIKASVDRVLALCEKAPDTYRYFLTHFFNKYRDAKSIGMDAIYVHIAHKYIATNRAPWIDDETKNQVLKATRAIEPTLIGKKAPDFQVQKKDGTTLSLYSIAAPFTVLFFWSPDCGHCQKSMPALEAFHSKYKTKGITIFAVCTKMSDQEKGCWEYLEKNDFKDWIHASDQSGGTSRINSTYNIRTTPKIYILGKDKTILAKDIGVEQLTMVMDRLSPQ